jgi:hypothetical protein
MFPVFVEILQPVKAGWRISTNTGNMDKWARGAAAIPRNSNANLKKGWLKKPPGIRKNKKNKLIFGNFFWAVS